ncbi:efflux RND transporter permease subunit [Salibacterium salarium]|uniref:Efflux RND transporter permease subunit n=1 Tax=Salibacterium salarium TaxID=284579 RepID=A0A428N9T5_9BACI|nr:efflux RND transporter permease subunit [Salibacterium salarium]
MTDFEKELPEGAEMEQLYTQADLVSELFSELFLAFAIAFLSVLLVCSIGLRFSTALSVAIAIPVSLAIAMIVLPFAGVGLDQISLIAFIISLGILVDDGIVVNENIDRRLRLGESPYHASVKGVRQVAVSVITSTLTVVFTFLPLLLLPGSAGAFIRPLPAVLIAAIIASTVVALVLIPIYRTIREEQKKTNRADPPSSSTKSSFPPRESKTSKTTSPGWFGHTIDNMASFYSRRILGKVVKRPLLISLSGLMVGTAAYGLIPFTPLEFFPDTDREEVFIEASLPEGTQLEDTEEKARDMEEWFYDKEEVESVSTYVGTTIPKIFGSSDGGGTPDSNDVNFLVYIDNEKTMARDAMNEWNVTLSDQFSEVEARGSIVESGPPVGAPIAVEVSGDDMKGILEVTDDIESLFAGAEGVTNTDVDAGNDLSAYQFSPDRETLENTGVTSEAITQELRLLGEGVPVGEWQMNNEIIDMRMVYDTKGTVSEDDIERVELTQQTNGAQRVFLADLVMRNETSSVQAIPHQNTERTVTVRAFLGDQDADSILAETEEELDAISEESSDYTITVGGETSERTDVFIDIGQIFIVVVFLIMIVIAIQFYSLIMPFLILSAVYLAVAGAVLGLFITQTGLGFMSMMGAVSLAGIVVRNGIVMIEFMEQRRKEGMVLEEAVRMVGQERFRPIILTSLTSIAGLLPIALGNNPLFQPLGIAIVSGLVFSTILTLVVIPALYVLKAKMSKS